MGRRALWSAIALAAVSYTQPANALEVLVRGDEPNLHYRLETREGKRIDSCRGHCTLHVAPGEYWLRVTGAADSGVRNSRRKLRLHEDCLLRVSPASEGGRSAGLLLGVTGPLVIVASFVVGQGKSSNTLPAIGAVAGGLMTVGGWYMFSHNAGPSVELEPGRRRASLTLRGTF